MQLLQPAELQASLRKAPAFTPIMYSGLRNGTTSTLQRLLQELGFHSYKQLQDTNSAIRLQNGEPAHPDASEIELSRHPAWHEPKVQSRRPAGYPVRSLPASVCF